jgi:hypothetical protein
MHKVALGLILLTLGAAAARAEENTGEAATTNAVRRDPFWPVGYAPKVAVAAPTAVVEEPPSEVKAGLSVETFSAEQQARLNRLLQVGGIMKVGDKYIGYLQNKPVEAGDEVAVNFEGQTLRFVVRSITKESVQLEPRKP